MKRHRRIVFNSLTALSLLLLVATAGLWVRDRYTADVATFQTLDPVRRTWVWHFVHASSGHLFVARHCITWPDELGF